MGSGDTLAQWWTISGDELMRSMKRAAAGEDPDLIYAELYANSDSSADLARRCSCAEVLVDGATPKPCHLHGWLSEGADRARACATDGCTNRATEECAHDDWIATCGIPTCDVHSCPRHGSGDDKR